jgi:hypothetical protein
MYLLPIQIGIFARLPNLVPFKFRVPVMVAIYFAFALLMAVWLFFSPFAQISWVPYENLLWTGGTAGQ